MVKEGKNSKESALCVYLKQGAFKKAAALVKSGPEPEAGWPFDRIFARLPADHQAYNDVDGCLRFLRK